jgi:hypothetical protein
MENDEKLQKELDDKDGVLSLKPNIVPEPYPGLDRLGVKNSRPLKVNTVDSFMRHNLLHAIAVKIMRTSPGFDVISKRKTL